MDVKAATPPVVVGGLDDEAETKAENGKTVTITMTVEKKEEQTLVGASDPVQTAIQGIKGTATPAKNLDFLEIKIEKTIDDGSAPAATTAITETTNVIEIVIPFDTSGKTNFVVYRHHDGEGVKTFTDETSSPTRTKADGTFYLDKETHLFHVFTQKFSTYAIGYDSIGGGSGGGFSGGGSSVGSFAITLPTDLSHGKVTADKTSAAPGSTVTLTVTPDNGFTLETLRVLDKNGKEVALTKSANGTYSFKMPASKVEIKATFMDDNTMLNFFVDVPASSYYYDAVLWAAENGITGGTDAVHFSPDWDTTRAQMVTFLWRANGCPEPKNTTCAFTDVKADAYYYKAVLWAAENGYTEGTSATTFSPDVTVSRAQAVTFLWRIAGKLTQSGANPFADVAQGKYYCDAVSWALGRKITEGTGATTFSPNNGCTRAQIVTFLYRYFVK